MEKIIHILIAVLVCLNTEVQSQTSDTNNVKSLPLVGDETPISAILARPRQYLGKEIILVGAVQVANYYNYRYENAHGTHYSLEFRALTKDLKETGGFTVYARRGFASALVDKIVAVQKEQKSKAIRLLVTITSRSFTDGEFNESAELMDWQFLNRETHEWEWWACKPKPLTVEQKSALAKAEQDRRSAELTRLASKKKDAHLAVLNFYIPKAEAGEGSAQMRLGEIYLHGEGVETNIPFARKWLSLALTNGYPRAADLLRESSNSPAATP